MAGVTGARDVSWSAPATVTGQPHGVRDLNRWVQQRFRAEQLRRGREPWGLAFGDEEIVTADKVILVRNGKTDGWSDKEPERAETSKAAADPTEPSRHARDWTGSAGLASDFAAAELIVDGSRVDRRRP